MSGAGPGLRGEGSLLIGIRRPDTEGCFEVDFGLFVTGQPAQNHAGVIRRESTLDGVVSCVARVTVAESTGVGFVRISFR
jgi:hypothetical protein